MRKLSPKGWKTANNIQLLHRKSKKHIWDGAFRNYSRQNAHERSLSHFDRSQHTGIPETSSTPADSMICLLKPINLPMCAYSYSNQASVTYNQKSPA